MTTRREFLQAVGLGVMTPFVLGAAKPRASNQSAADPTTVFGLSVASGDPSPSGVVLWTRVNPSAIVPGAALAFVVATDKRLRDVVLSGSFDAADFGEDRDFTVHLDLDGLLESNAVYYYQFQYQDVASRVGRCRTLPAEDARLASLRLGVLTCQDYTNGYYGAFARLAEESIDFVLHLGDFIYETSGDPDFQPLPYPDRTFALPSGASAATGLEDFRFLYRTYRSDPYFQKALESHTFICLWDDHETANDCYWDYARDTLGAPDHPFTVDQQGGGDPQQLKQLKLDAQRAWAEYVPARVTLNPEATHPFDYLRIYRSFKFGSLVDLFVTDERTYRTAQPCGPDERILTPGCDARTSPAQSMLGETQKEWFLAGMSASTATWKAWANEVFLGELKLGQPDSNLVYITLDGWDGYDAERREILTALSQGGVTNLVALTGDLHSYLASYLKIDYRDRSNRPGPNVVGVEFMTPAVTSATLIDQLLILLSGEERESLAKALVREPSSFLLERVAKAANPHIQFFNSQEWGYSIVEFTPRDCTYSAYSIPTSTNSGELPKQLIRQFRVPVNQVRLQQVQ